MNDEQLIPHLSKISTCWTVVRHAHGGDEGQAVGAREKLLRVYGPSVRRYLQVVLGDAHAADDLAQEFAVAFLRGEFRNADPRAGRFRNYVKAVLFHLVSAYRKKQKRTPDALSPDNPALEALATAPEDTDREFNETWRDELLSRTWKELVESNAEYYAVLRFRAANDRLTSQQMAEQLGGTLGRPLNAAAVRQTLRRARAEFVRLLRAEVAESVEAEQIDDELSDLGLLEYCQLGSG